jgi:hypothetical protein
MIISKQTSGMPATQPMIATVKETTGPVRPQQATEEEEHIISILPGPTSATEVHIGATDYQSAASKIFPGHRYYTDTLQTTLFLI